MHKVINVLKRQRMSCITLQFEDELTSSNVLNSQANSKSSFYSTHIQTSETILIYTLLRKKVYNVCIQFIQ